MLLTKTKVMSLPLEPPHIIINIIFEEEVVQSR